MDLYGYITITTPTRNRIDDDIRTLFDRLQTLDERFPLRIVPLEVIEFTPVTPRLDGQKELALKNQWIAIERWQREMEERFSVKDRSANITDIILTRHKN